MNLSGSFLPCFLKIGFHSLKCTSSLYLENHDFIFKKFFFGKDLPSFYFSPQSPWACSIFIIIIIIIFATHMAYGSSWARDRILAAAVTYTAAVAMLDP